MYDVRVIAHPTLRPVLVAAALAAVGLGSASARAHFILQSPPSAYEQNFLGDPQKAPPCGDEGNAVGTGVITSFQGGDTITITIDETIFHPGHYRIALAVNDISELPEEPPVTPNNTPCGTVPIMNPPVFPVLADGVFVHEDPFAGPQSIDIKLPADINCDNCTLQVIQFMSNHGLNNPGGCFYHHCAAISVTSVGASTGGDTTSGGGTDGTTGAPATTTATTATSMGSTGGDSSATGSATSDGATSDPGTGGTGGTGGGSAGSTGAASDSATGGTKDESGCGCTSAPTGGSALALLALVGLGVRRRRRA